MSHSYTAIRAYQESKNLRKFVTTVDRWLSSPAAAPPATTAMATAAATAAFQTNKFLVIAHVNYRKFTSSSQIVEVGDPSTSWSQFQRFGSAIFFSSVHTKSIITHFN